jgi:diguanylate cyclase (GGDEF)-like protein
MARSDEPNGYSPSTTMSTDELARRRHGIPAPIVAAPPDSADEDRRLAAEDRRLAAEDRRQAASYLSAAYRDDTTGALNRPPGREQMQLLLDRARRDASELTFLFVDVDGLKQVNDSEGHGCGDELLAAVGSALRSSLRSYDLVVRYGGDEFVCALPGGTARAAAERLVHVRVALDDLVAGATVSAGCAELRPTDTLDAVIRRADTDLHRGRLGRRPSAGRRLSAAATAPVAAGDASVACGACGGRVPLTEFVLELTARMTRSADCPNCGATTLIELSPDSTPPGSWLHLGDG